MQENAIKVQKRLRSKARHPVQQAADIVEQVLATDGDLYLHTKQHALSWWQLSLLDVKLFLAATLLSVLALIAVIIRRLVQLGTSKFGLKVRGKEDKRKTT